MKYIFFTLFITLFAGGLFAQDADSSAAEKEPKTVLEAFKKGELQGHFRNFFMVTDNTRDLSDYYAWAFGGGLHYTTEAFHGFRFGMSGIFIYDLKSSDLAKPDSSTGALNRYEVGLFDVTDPANKTDLDRMEEFWLRYEWKKSRITLGQQMLKTPFINPQDGRMRPTVESGLWLETEDLKDTRIEGGWLWAVSPRSTVEWYGIGESFGIYPKGRNPDGSPSGYPGHVESKGIGLLGITRQLGSRTSLQLWEQYVEGVYNTVFAQVDHQIPLKKGHKILVGLQFAHQDPLASGGNEDPALAYFPEDARSNVISAQAGWQRGSWQALAAYTRITADGRFLAPREWGREPFYTFMPRERVEGNGDIQAVTGRLSWLSARKKLRLEAAYGRFYLTDPVEAALNKYAFPSYGQLNLDARYTFGGPLKGLRMQLLLVRKDHLGSQPVSDKYVINKVDMTHVNVVLNYSF